MIVGLLILAVVAVVGLKMKKQGATGSVGCANGVCTLPIPSGRPATEDARSATPVPKPLPVLLELGSVNCVPCKMMDPILDELRETFSGKLEVNFIDVWQDEEAGKQYGIQSIPIQIFFDADGNELFRHQGFYPREDIVAKWKELGYGFAEPKNNE